MGISPAFRRVVALSSAVICTTALAASMPIAASADTKPASSSIPTTVSSDSLPTAQLSGGVGWAQAVSGNTVFIGGNFSGALAAGATSGTVARTDLLSYNLTTGALNSFAPTLNGQVLSLTTSPDGTILYVGGNFTTVNGSTRNHLAAFNVSSGALLSWNPNVSGYVNAIQATSSTVYFGGQFSSVAGTTRTRAAAVSASSGALTTWAPTGLDNAPKSMQLSPDGSKIAIGGFFSTIDGGTGSGFGIVDTTTGTTLMNTPIRAAVDDGSTTSAIYGLSSDGTSVYGSGYYSQQAPDGSGNLEGTFSVNWNTGATTWLNDCHGDEYDSAPLNGALYIVGHPHYCYDIPGGYPQQQLPGVQSPTYQRTIAVTTASSGQNVGTNTILQPRYYDRSTFQAPTMLDWFPTLTAGTFTGASQAAYNVIVSGNYVLEVGEFPKVNGTTQYGIARFALPSIAPNTDGPQLSGTTWPIYGSTLTAGTPRISWLANYDRDNENLTYTVYRDGTAVYTTTAASRIWYQRPAMSFTDTGASAGSHTYKVTATDPYGNAKTSASLAYTAASSAQSAYAQQIVADGASSYWRLGESSGTSVADTAGGLPGTAFGGVTLGTAGAISGDSNTAATFDGTTGTTIASIGQMDATDTFSVEAWFKSTSSTGGEIIGAGDDQTQTTTTMTGPMGTMTRTSDSSNHDREISTTADGHVTFTVDPGAVDTITSSAGGYNDGKWHQVVGTLSSKGMVLYVDGQSAATNASVTRAVGAEMYWRIGGDSGYNTAAPDPNAPPGPPAAVNNYFTGSVDEPAAFIGKALSASQVANEYSLANGGTTTPTNNPPTASFTDTVSGLGVNVDGSASSDSDGSIKSYAWTFGDGGTATGATASHTYGAAGTYTVTLTVTDDGGATGTTSQSVQVSSGTTTNTTIAADAFGRTVAKGLGSADTGGAYTLTGGSSNFSVNGSNALLSATKGTTLMALLGGTSSSDTDATVTTALSAVPAGGSSFYWLSGRSVGGQDYRARVTIPSGGASVTIGLYQGSTLLKNTTVSGLSYAAGDRLQVRVQVYGTSPTTIRARVWKVGTTEPSTWQVTTTDSTAALQTAGSVGFGAYTGSGATTSPIVYSFGALQAVPTGN